jgi:hypothetical protein
MTRDDYASSDDQWSSTQRVDVSTATSEQVSKLSDVAALHVLASPLLEKILRDVPDSIGIRAALGYVPTAIARLQHQLLQVLAGLTVDEPDGKELCAQVKGTPGMIYSMFRCGALTSEVKPCGAWVLSSFAHPILSVDPPVWSRSSIGEGSDATGVITLQLNFEVLMGIPNRQPCGHG